MALVQITSTGDCVALTPHQLVDTFALEDAQDNESGY